MTTTVKVLCLQVAALFCLDGLFAQDNPNYIKMPVSPDVYSMYKATEIPVGHFTGSANINVPVYTISLGDFNWPISLSYGTTGIKAEELAGNTGLGWTLNATGVLNQQVNGKSDFIGNGGYPLDSTYASDFSGDGPLYYNTGVGNDPYFLAKRLANGEIDWATDLFSYNLGGFSGKFFYDQFGQAHSMPVSQVKIDLFHGPYYSITDEKGVAYLFKDTDVEEYEYDACYNVSNGASFYLSKIKTPSGKWINFEYDTLTYSYTTLNSEIKSKWISGYVCSTAGDVPESNNSCSTTTNIVHGKFLKRITSSSGDVVTFNYSTGTRLDLPGSKYITSIVVKYKDSSFVKKVNLDYGYFDNASGYAPGKRLKLNKVTEESATGETHKLYEMAYDESLPLPDRITKSQDHWGYYNGKANTTLLPWNVEFNFVGANREIDFNYAKLGALKKLTYPTGGYSTFEYEANDYYANGFGNVDTFALYESPQYNSAANRDTTYSITIPSSVKNITLTWNMSDCPGGDPYTDPPPDNLTIVFTNNCGVSYSWDCNSPNPAGLMVDIPAGSYTVTLSNSGSTVSGYFKISWWLDYSYYPTGTRQTGGLRIKKITYQPDSLAAPQITRYVYRDFSDTARSSGQYTNLPTYTYGQTVFRYKSIVGCYLGCDQSCSEEGENTLMETVFHVLRGNSVLPLSSISGSYVGYTNITEIRQDNSNNGKTEYTYNFNTDPGGDYGFPFSVRGTNEWKRGQLLKKAVYKYDPTTGSQSLINSEENFYSERDYGDFWSRLYTPESNVADVYKGAGILVSYKAPELSRVDLYFARFYIGKWNYISKWYRLDSTRNINSENGSSLQSVTRFFYNGSKHIQLTGQRTTDSKGLTDSTTILYPQDYTGVAAMDSLVKQNRVAVPIETKKYKNSTLISSLKNEFKNWTSTLTDLEKVKTSKGNFPYVQEIIFNHRDNLSNIRDYVKRDGITGSAIWDYDSSLMIASVSNAAFNQVAYTSFESNGSGNWTIGSGSRDTTTALTGRQCYDLTNGNISTSMPNGSYVISFWSKRELVATAYQRELDLSFTTNLTLTAGKTVNGWTYYEGTADNCYQFTISYSGGFVIGADNRRLIDEVRVYPKTAQMTTYTYNPLVGITSTTDANGLPTYYEYDPFNRLKFIKDFTGNIIKSFQYNYSH